LLREQQGNQVLYQANRSCPLYPELASIFRKTLGVASIFEGSLEGLKDQIEFAFIFGSMAAGTQNQFSDIDLLVLG
jgi:predicted nucleotidyltransferase